MSDSLDTNIDYPSAYEALVEFLYLAPVGIIKFRPDGTIDMANPVAAQLLMPLAANGDMSNLFTLLAGLAPDLKSHVERFREPAGQIFDQMQLVSPSTATILMLDINKINDGTFMAAVQNITDLSDARRQAMRATETQKLLASVFMRLNLPVLIVRADGFIVLVNTALQNLLRYTSSSLVGLNVDALLPPDSAEAAHAARAQQMIDGGSYQLEMPIVARDGLLYRVTLHSSVLRESEAQQLRVLTLLPYQAGSSNLAAPSPDAGGRLHQVTTIDISDYRTAIGADWPFLGARAMKLSEEMISSQLKPGDIVKQGKTSSFILWLSDSDPIRNAATVAKARQAIRRVFMNEFGSKIAGRVADLAA